MTGKQNAVMWLGLLLIAVRLFTTDQWSSLWSAVDTGSSSSSSGSSDGGVIGLGNPAGTTTLPPAKKGAPTITTPTTFPMAVQKSTGLWLVRQTPFLR